MPLDCEPSLSANFSTLPSVPIISPRLTCSVKVKMDKRKNGKNYNGKLSLRHLKFEEAVKAILQVKPESKKPKAETIGKAD
jgi:hypothetical protein